MFSKQPWYGFNQTTALNVKVAVHNAQWGSYMAVISPAS